VGRQQLAVADDAQAAGSLGDEGVTAGEECDRPRLDKRVYVGDDPVVVNGRPGYRLAEQLRSTKQGKGDNRECSSHRYTIIRAAMAYRSPYPDIQVPDRSLTEQVFSHAAAKPDAIAMADGLTGRTITYGSLLEQIRQTAAGLAERGITKGDVVSLWSPNVPEWPVVFFAVVRLGAIVHTSNPVSTAEELAFQLTDAKSKMLFTVGALSDKAKAAIEGSNRPIELFTIDETPGIQSLASIAIDQDPPAVSIDPAHDIVVLPYSSGTTGLPKGVMLTHRNVVAQLAQIDAIENVEMPALLGVLPFFHIYGMVIILMHGFMRVATIVTLPKFEFEPFLKVLQEWPITSAHIVPPVVVALGKHPLVDSYKFPHLKYIAARLRSGRS
jgi:acyl-CoA synthetase (AMP-forming)/AMP-acid ligase II